MYIKQTITRSIYSKLSISPLRGTSCYTSQPLNYQSSTQIFSLGSSLHEYHNFTYDSADHFLGQTHGIHRRLLVTSLNLWLPL